MKYKHREREYLVDRGELQDLFYTLYYRTGLDTYDEYDNEVFTVRPYCWGECDCGYQEKEDEFYENAPDHSKDCFHTKYRKFEKVLKALGLASKSEAIILDAWARSHGYERGINGIACHCTCGLDEILRKWHEENDHSDDCCLRLPNFVYKPDGLEIEWYKYPLRGSYSNKPITYEYLSKVIDHCVRSFKVNQGDQHGTE